MNLSRLATLAVFFMMVMSAFVTVPTYNVGADEHEGSGDDRGDDEDVVPTAAHATMTMESLEDWMVEFQLEMPIDWSNEARNEISSMCEMMLGTPPGEINQECFDHWVMMLMSDDHGEHDHDDEFRCPPEMDDATCATFTECFDNILITAGTNDDPDKYYDFLKMEKGNYQYATQYSVPDNMNKTMEYWNKEKDMGLNTLPILQEDYVKHLSMLNLPVGSHIVVGKMKGRFDTEDALKKLPTNNKYHGLGKGKYIDKGIYIVLYAIRKI